MEPADFQRVVDVLADGMVDTEDRAWARLEEKILAEVSCDSSSQDATFPVGNITDLEEILVFEDEGGGLKFLDQVWTS